MRKRNGLKVGLIAVFGIALLVALGYGIFLWYRWAWSWSNHTLIFFVYVSVGIASLENSLKGGKK